MSLGKPLDSGVCHLTPTARLHPGCQCLHCCLLSRLMQSVLPQLPARQASNLDPYFSVCDDILTRSWSLQIRLDADPEISTPNTVNSGCQWQPSDSGIVHDDLLKGRLVPIAPTRLKWTSPVLQRLKMLDDKYRREERQLNVGIHGFTPAQRQIVIAGMKLIV
jgi:hypothetical protein